jgi:hypothetical protein
MSLGKNSLSEYESYNDFLSLNEKYCKLAERNPKTYTL